VTGPPEPSKTVIGWKERVTLPEWGVEGIVAKADTGARTGAIDVASIEERPGGRVRFGLVLARASRGGDGAEVRTIETAVTRRSRVRSSFGASHDRLFVETEVRLGGLSKRIELGLVCRKNMLCRMLLGRAALAPEFIVDPARRRTLGRGRRGRREEKA